MLKRTAFRIVFVVSVAALFSFIASGVQAAAAAPGRDKSASEQAAPGEEISTDELQKLLSTGKVPVIDVRPAKEYGIAHIPGSTSIFENDISRMVQACPDKSAVLVLYCNGPFCHKTNRVAEELSKLGYVNIKKYQLGLPGWRAFGNTAETDLAGVRYVFAGDKTAVFVDARPENEFKAGTVPGAVNLKAGETEAANRDGRLPYNDHGTRVIVFGSAADQARQLAVEIAQRAYWNSSYFPGTYDDLKQAGMW